jgi:hypothetical protein
LTEGACTGDRREDRSAEGARSRSVRTVGAQRAPQVVHRGPVSVILGRAARVSLRRRSSTPSSPPHPSMLSRSSEAAQAGSCQACGRDVSGQLLLLSPPPPCRNVPADSSSRASPIPPPLIYVLGQRRFAALPESPRFVRKAAFIHL